MFRHAYNFITSKGNRRFVLICASIIVIAGVLGTPGYLRHLSNRRMVQCQENLFQIEYAMEQWALDNNKGPGERVTLADLVRPGQKGYLGSLPKCPSGGAYLFSIVADVPQCDSQMPGHKLTPMLHILRYGDNPDADCDG